MPLLADTNWEVVIGAIGAAVVLVIGAIGREWYKVAAARWAFEREQKAANEKAEKESAANERANRRDTDKELYRLLDVKEKDVQQWRDHVHDVNNQLGTLSNRLAVCEWDRTRLRIMVEDQGAALQEAGIPVRYRAIPEQPPGVVEMHGPDALKESSE